MEFIICIQFLALAYGVASITVKFEISELIVDAKFPFETEVELDLYEKLPSGDTSLSFLVKQGPMEFTLKMAGAETLNIYLENEWRASKMVKNSSNLRAEIVKMFAYGKVSCDGDIPKGFRCGNAIITEFVKSENLKELLKTWTGSETQKYSVGVDIVDGLDALARSGITLRNLSPTTVLCRERAKLAAGVISDLSKSYFRDTSLHKPTYGSVMYMCPFVQLGQDPTPVTDLRSLGYLLAETEIELPWKKHCEIYEQAGNDGDVALQDLLVAITDKKVEFEENLATLEITPKLLQVLIAIKTEVNNPVCNYSKIKLVLTAAVEKQPIQDDQQVDETPNKLEMAPEVNDVNTSSSSKGSATYAPVVTLEDYGDYIPEETERNSAPPRDYYEVYERPKKPKKGPAPKAPKAERAPRVLPDGYKDA